MTADDYLRFTEADALAQWCGVLARSPRARQVVFAPIEIVLCFGLFYVLNPHSYGGRNIDRAPAELEALAGLLCRSPGSLTNKMLNLDGARANAGRAEPEVFLRLSSDPELFLRLYRRVLHAARAAGISSLRLPDFLDAEGGALQLLGQDELGSAEIEQVAEERRAERESWAREHSFDPRETTRLVEGRVRLGQHRFAKTVLQNYDRRCGFCGFAPRSLGDVGMLVASHIKPWSHSSDRERLDPANGIAACPVHDRAFDAGLLTVNGGLAIHRAAPLEGSLLSDSGSANYFAAPVLRPRLIAPSRGAPRPAYLAWHREHLFERWSAA